MDFSIEQLDDLAAEAGRRNAYVVAALDRDGEGWRLRTCEAIIGAQPPNWRRNAWEYPSHAFVAVAMSAGRLLALFEPGSTSAYLGPFRVSATPCQSTVSVRHLPSRAPYEPAPLPWPTHDFEFHALQPTAPIQPTGILVGEGCPTFPDAESARRAFFYGDFSTIGAGLGTTRPALVRRVERSAWIEGVKVGPSHLEVRVRGMAIERAGIEINSSTLRARLPVRRQGTHRIALPEGLPPDAWLYLTRGSTWLDYRPLGPRLPGSASLSSRGVEVVVPDDPESRLQALLAQGEGPRLEFKLSLPPSGAVAAQGAVKTVAAFATGDGGFVVFGMDRDEVTAVGLAGANEQQERDRLGDLIRRYLRPTPEFRCSWVSIADKRLLTLEVLSGALPPYGIQLAPDGNIAYYVRRGASTFPATQQEIREAARRVDLGTH